MSRRKATRRGICVFCGHRGMLTADHVPPKCLLGQRGNLPSDLITVPACERCNLSASGDDEYLRLALAPTLEASQHSVACSLMPAIVRSLDRREGAGFAKNFFQNAAFVKTFTNSRIYVGKRLVQRADHVRLTRIIDKIIRGLFFKEYQRQLPRSHVVSSLFTNHLRRHIRRDDFEVWRHQIRELLAGGRGREVGQRTFIYRCNRHPERVFCSVWALTFYGTLHFVAFTSTPSQVRKASTK